MHPADSRCQAYREDKTIKYNPRRNVRTGAGGVLEFVKCGGRDGGLDGDGDGPKTVAIHGEFIVKRMSPFGSRVQELRQAEQEQTAALERCCPCIE